MRTIRDITTAFADLARTPAGATAVEVMVARNYGMLLAALVGDDIGEILSAASEYQDVLQDVLLYNGPTARDQRLLNGVWVAMDILYKHNAEFKDLVYETLNNALNTYNRSR